MAMSTDIKLPRDQVPLFPMRCVRCGNTAPDSAYRLRLEPIFYARYTRPPGVAKAYEVPACRGCARSMDWQRRMRSWGYLVFLSAGMVLYFFLLRGTFGGSKTAVLILAAVWSTPCLAWAIWAPRVIATTEMSSGIDYEFANRDYAIEFALLNRVSGSGDSEG